MKIRVLFLFAALLSLPLAVMAQTSRGTVSGFVTDPNGAVVSGAEVTLTSAQTNLGRTTTSNDEGFYRFEAVDSGTYSIKVTGQASAK